MGLKVFLTGGTGYIGGSILEAIVRLHPEHSVTLLLRNVPPGFEKAYPNVKIVKGDFDDTELISATAADADIVIHNGNSKHEPSIKAHIAGLLRSATPSSPRYLLRLGGTGVIADWADPTYHGATNPKVWSDVADIDATTSLPDTALHRNIEKIVQTATAKHGDRLRCAIICSCGVYGPGRGPGKTQSSMVPLYYAQIQKTRRAFYANSGGNTRSWVHIDDLVMIYMKLIAAAVAGGGGADWGREGYYFTASQEWSQLEFAKATGEILRKHNIIEDAQPLQLPMDQIKTMTGSSKWPYQGIYVFACNTRTRSDRARTVLGYEPKAPSLWECLESDILATVESCL